MSSSSAVDHLVSFLTRPLMRSLAPTTIVSLQVYLHRALSSSPQPLVLSAACPPPPAIQQACIVSGVRWDDWIQRLSSGIDLKIFLTESSLAVKLGAMPRRIIWVAANNAPFTPKHARASSFRAPPMISFGSRLRMRGSLFPARTRARDSRGAVLNPTRVPTLLSFSYTADDLTAECDIDSDSDSDSLDSDIESDSGSSCTSASSTSAACSAPSRSAMHTAKANPDSAAYTCQGGVSGGVMLGVSAAPKFQFQPQPRLRRAAVSLSNARRPSGVSQNTNTVRKTAAATAESWRRSAA